MIIIHHRRNTIKDLQETPSQYGVEIDLRSWNQDIVLQHDPFKVGESFVEWLKNYRHRLLILNVKEEGLEEAVISLMQKHKIDHYFFLDQSFPFLVRTSRRGEPRCAVRVSEFESFQTALSLRGKIEWVWVDCFTHFSLKKEEALALKQAGFKLCLVSPELQGRFDQEEIKGIRKQFSDWGVLVDAVCTKTPGAWG